VAGGIPVTTLDDAAFECEITERTTGRSQTLIRGIFKPKYYKTGGILCNLATLTKYFPLENYRLICQLDNTGTYYNLYDHANKKLKMYSDVNTQVSDKVDVSALEIPFMAVGE
jgi:hypothetical protein